ncbi:MAG: M3 family metallopeptidase, partial [Balneolales bacterium]
MRVPTLAGVCACMMLTSACAPDELSIMETNFTPDNPFFTASTLPFEAPDFDVIRIEHYRPAFEAGMERQLADIGEIAGNPAPPTFENTIAAMERTGTLLTRVSRVFFNMTSAHTNEEIQEIQAEIAPKLAAHSDDIHLNGRLFERIETLHDNIEQLDLGQEGRQLLRDIRRDFVRAGALLSDQEQDRVREINEKTSSLTTLFQENLLAVTRERAVITDHVEDLNGLSADRIAAAKEAAEDRGHEGKYLLSITNTTRQPILSSLDNREFRKRVWEASAYRGVGENGGVDNRPVILELVRLRAERARLLGHPDWASFALETQTAQTPANALEMMGRLVDPVLANTKQEAEQITARMRRDGIDDELQPWDWEYYAEKVRMDRYDIDEDDVRPYFEL